MGTLARPFSRNVGESVASAKTADVIANENNSGVSGRLPNSPI